MNFRDEIKKLIDEKTKPIGSLGVVETISEKICLIQRTKKPALIDPKIIIFAGDHGIAKSGVSKYPQEVTYQMVNNFLNGGAAINVFSKTSSIELQIVDSGVNFDFKNKKNLIDKKIGFGTNNFIDNKAMTKTQLKNCFESGKDIINKVSKTKTNIIGFGEMGIGNTSSASMIMSYLLKLPLSKCIGTGTGLNTEQLNNKVKILNKAKNFHGAIDDVYKILETFAGFEIVQMCSAILESYEKNMIILVDGFIASSAFLAALKINPKIINNTFFTHRSSEFGHKYLLENINVNPILDLKMKLGEGTGCALAYPIIQNAVNFINDMATFENAKVSTESND
tara:strand:+ start:1190 stop:2203 length:1014 start_codon:yes stop_codon:yes gene_type:complete